MQADLERLDGALMRLRRLWTTPRAHDGLRAGLDTDVELSTVLVVEALARDGDDRDTGTGVAEVAARIDVAASTASRLVDRAVIAGVVERRTSSADARRADLRLTEAGWALHERARDFRAAYLGTVLMDWPTDSIGALAELVDRFADAVADTPPTPDEGDDT